MIIGRDGLHIPVEASRLLNNRQESPRRKERVFKYKTEVFPSINLGITNVNRIRADINKSLFVNNFKFNITSILKLLCSMRAR
jgi:hypothetical protein